MNPKEGFHITDNDIATFYQLKVNIVAFLYFAI